MMILMKFDGKYATINGIAVLNGNTGTIDICSSSSHTPSEHMFAEI